jgi:hypothetical protein
MQVKGESGACGGPVRGISAIFSHMSCHASEVLAMLGPRSTCSRRLAGPAIEAQRTPTDRWGTDHGIIEVSMRHSAEPRTGGDSSLTGAVRSVGDPSLVAQSRLPEARMDPI